MLGPDCVLVRCAPSGFRCIAPGDARAIQASVLGQGHDPDWLFEQSRRIAQALATGETSLAQIYGLRIPVGDLDDGTMRRIATAARLIKANFDPNQARIPHGEPGAGQWIDEGNPEALAPFSTSSGAGEEGNPNEPAPSSGSSGADGEGEPPPEAPTDDVTVADVGRKSICIERCAHLLERALPYRWSNLNTFAFYRCVNDCMSAAG